MKQLTLAEYVNIHGQEKTAKTFGIYQSAINKVIHSKRKITVFIYEDGKVEAKELKPFPSQRPNKKLI
uniref:Regulatory protein cro n=1 Tax=Arsenophonus endosymbiont of Trialeurodes vaporariorum TaxID=235567 RepID=A0A3B0MGY9_9GAMM